MHAVELAVPRHDARPRIGVDEEAREEASDRNAFDRVDARVRVPAALHDLRSGLLVHLPAHRLDRAGDDMEEIGAAVRDGRHQQNRAAGEGDDPEPARQQRRRHHRRDGREQQRDFSAHQLQQHADGHRAKRRAEQIGEIERAGARPVEIENHRQRDAAEEERHERRHEIQRQPLQLEWKLDQDPEARGNRDAVEHREHGRLFDRRRPRLLQQMHGQAAEAPAEQRHRDRDEGEVIPDRRRIDACQADFEDKSRQRDKKNRSANEHEGYKL